MGELAAFLTAFCWSWTSVFFTLASRRVGSLTVNILRLPLGTALLLAACLVTGKGFAIDSYQLWMLSLSGIIGLALGDAFLFESFVLIGPRLGTLLFTSSPAMTTALAYLFLGESIGPFGLLGMTTTLAGVTWVVLEKRDGRERFNLRGTLFALLGALGQSVGLVLAKPVLLSGIDPLYATLLRMTAATAAAVALASFLGLPRFVKVLFSRDRAVLFLTGGVVFGPVLGVYLSQVAIKLTHTGIAATLFATMPILMIPISFLVMGERISLRAVIGTVIAVVGVALLFLR